MHNKKHHHIQFHKLLQIWRWKWYHPRIWVLGRLVLWEIWCHSLRPNRVGTRKQRKERPFVLCYLGVNSQSDTALFKSIDWAIVFSARSVLITETSGCHCWSWRSTFEEDWEIYLNYVLIDTREQRSFIHSSNQIALFPPLQLRSQLHLLKVICTVRLVYVGFFLHREISGMRQSNIREERRWKVGKKKIGNGAMCRVRDHDPAWDHQCKASGGSTRDESPARETSSALEINLFLPLQKYIKKAYAKFAFSHAN